MLVLAHLHRSVLTQQVHSLGHLAFKWRSSFAKALAKLSPNFREKSPNSFYKMIHIYIINTKYKYLQCNLDMCTWTFAKTLARKKKSFAISEKTLAETVDCIPKGLRKGNPFHGPFAQLSYTLSPTSKWQTTLLGNSSFSFFQAPTLSNEPCFFSGCLSLMTFRNNRGMPCSCFPLLFLLTTFLFLQV